MFLSRCKEILDKQYCDYKIKLIQDISEFESKLNINKAQAQTKELNKSGNNYALFIQS